MTQTSHLYCMFEQRSLKMLLQCTTNCEVLHVTRREHYIKVLDRFTWWTSPSCIYHGCAGPWQQMTSKTAGTSS